jgi:hypothetical protein
MPFLTKNDLIQMMGQLTGEQKFVFKLHETFGGGAAVLELNSLYPQKKQKKFLLRTGKNVELAKNAKPLWASDKAKDLAGWVSDRAIEIIEQPAALKEAV